MNASDKNKKESVVARDEAKKWAVVGGLSGVGVLLIEAVPTIFTDLEDISRSVRQGSKKAKISLAIGAVALGALGYAAYKHEQAAQLRDKAEASEANWSDRIQNNTSTVINR